MHVDLKVTLSEEYFSQVGKEIDWEENDSTKIPVKQAEELQKILTTEVSIFLLRRAYGICGSLSENMINIRRELINNYEKEYETYIEYNDFY